MLLGWQHIFDAEVADLAQLRKEIVWIDGMRCRDCEPKTVATQTNK